MSRIILFMAMLSCLAFALVAPVGDDDDDKARRLMIEFNTSCDGNIVAVFNQDGEPVEGAEVDVFDEQTLFFLLEDEPTDSNGRVTFEGCSKKVRIIATKEVPHHTPYNIIRDLIECERCVPSEPCETDNDCPGIVGIAQCVENECEPTPCETDEECPEYFGIAGLAQCVDEGCEPTPCETDADCPVYSVTGMIICEEDQCVPKPCDTNDDCPVGARCVDESCAPSECEEDTDCPYPERCIDRECEPNECEEDEDCVPYATAGIVLQCIDNECTPPECEEDGDCPENARCRDGRCTPPGCEKDEDCTERYYCNIPEGDTKGNCEPVTGEGCGYIEDHAWVQYECDDNCPCPAGMLCCNNVCVEYTLDTSVEGNEIVVSVAGIPVDCDHSIEVIDPEGERDSYPPDSSGMVRIPVTMSGQYIIALLDGKGELLAKEEETIFPKEEEKPKDFFQMLMESAYIWLLALVILLIILYLYWRKRGEAPLE